MSRKLTRLNNRTVVRVWRLSVIVSRKRCQPFAFERGCVRFGWGIALWV